MTHRMTFIAAPLFVLTFTAGALAFGQDGAPGKAPPQQGPAGGGPGGAGGAERKRPVFTDMDKNGDGSISSDEVTPEQWERLKKLDTNGDGKVSKEEFEKARPGRKPGEPGRRPGGGRGGQQGPGQQSPGQQGGGGSSGGSSGGSGGPK
jgi:translation initiation factor IF-2